MNNLEVECLRYESVLVPDVRCMTRGTLANNTEFDIQAMSAADAVDNLPGARIESLRNAFDQGDVDGNMSRHSKETNFFDAGSLCSSAHRGSSIEIEFSC